MPLLGKAAMLLSFDIVQDAIAEHDDWHTHEHLPERLSIPGFLRGTRWVSLHGAPRYFVMYEVESLATLVSDAYLQRLNNPTPWTSKMMPHYRGMARGLCSVVGSFGAGMGHFGLLVRFSPASSENSTLCTRLVKDILPALPMRPGLGSVHLLEAAVQPQMTNEQRIRGTDTGIDRALFATGYSESNVAALAEAEFSRARLEEQDAKDVVSALFRTDYTLTEREVGALNATVST